MRAVKVQLTNGGELIVHDPPTQYLTVFLKSLPALQAIGKIIEKSRQEADGILGLPEVPDQSAEGLYPLLAIMTDVQEGDTHRSLTVDEFKALPVWDGIAVFKAFNALVPTNFTTAPVVTN